MNLMPKPHLTTNKIWGILKMLSTILSPYNSCRTLCGVWGQFVGGLLQHHQSKAHLCTQLNSWLRISAIFWHPQCCFFLTKYDLSQPRGWIGLAAQVWQPLPRLPHIPRKQQSTCFAPKHCTACLSSKWEFYSILANFLWMNSALEFVGLICLWRWHGLPEAGVGEHNMGHTTLQKSGCVNIRPQLK